MLPFLRDIDHDPNSMQNSRWHRPASARLLFLCIALVACDLCTIDWVKATETASPNYPPESVEFFESRIRPVLVEHCYECHSTQSETLRANLVLDHASGLLTGGDSGPVLVPGKPEESLLMAALNYTD